MSPVDFVILLFVALVVGLSARFLARAARAGGASWRSRFAWAVLGGTTFLVVMVTTAVGVARLVAGPGAPDGCAGDECDANMALLFPLLFLGIPVGVAVGLGSLVGLRRLVRSAGSRREREASR